MKIIINILINYWKNKVMIIDDMQIFKLFVGVLCLISAFFIGVVESILLSQENLVALIILITLIVQYNRPTIIMHLTEKKKSLYLVSNSKTFLRFCAFQVIKQNFILPIFLLVTIILTPTFLYLKSLYILFIWIIILIELMIYIFIVKHQLKKQYEDKYSMDNKKWLFNSNIKSLNLLYFSRIRIKEYLELIFQFVVLIVSAQFVSGIIVNYILLVFLVVDIELLEDQKMENYANYYGKYAVKKVAQVKKLTRFFLSEEFKIFLKYILLQAAIIIYSGPKQLVFLLLMLAISYRYFCGIEKLLGERTLFKYTWFRLCMFYLVILALVPFIFEENFKKLAGYQPLYGYLYLIGMGILLLSVPFEKIIKMSGDSVDE